jgi:HTH-like domain
MPNDETGTLDLLLPLPSAAAREKALRERIVAICEEFSRYGYRRVTRQRRAEGMSINHKTVVRIMGFEEQRNRKPA